MEILGVGPGELLVVFVLALLFIGPRRMPEVASQLGKAIREFQKASAELTQAIGAEIEAAEAEKAAIAAAQEAVLTTTATGDIISEAEEIAARAERDYQSTSVPALVSGSETEAPDSTATPSEQASESTLVTPAVAPQPKPVEPGMESLPLSLLTASNASNAELVGTLAPPPPVAVERPEPDGDVDARAEDQSPTASQALIPGLPLLPESLLISCVDNAQLARTAFGASYMGLGTAALRFWRRKLPEQVAHFEALPEALLTPSTGEIRG